MPCMCGDTYCPSCGPAQGNVKCRACGKWSFDGECKNPKKCKAIEEKMDEVVEEGEYVCAIKSIQDCINTRRDQIQKFRVLREQMIDKYESKFGKKWKNKAGV